MGMVKHLIPKQIRAHATEYIKDNAPEVIQKQLANAITLGGFVLKLMGRRDYGTKKGLAEITASLFSDDVDGDWARAFDAATRGGAFLDAFLNDKLGVAILWPKMWKANKNHPIRRRALELIAAKNVTISVLNGVAHFSGNRIERSPAGAINWYNDCMVMGFITIGNTFENDNVQKAVDTYVVAGSVAGLATGAAAIASYLPSSYAKKTESEIIAA